MLKIENQLEKEAIIFSKLGDLCKQKEYIDEFKTMYPDDVEKLYEIFGNETNVEKYVKMYLRRSFVNGRLRYRIQTGINRNDPKTNKSKQIKRKNEGNTICKI